MPNNVSSGGEMVIGGVDPNHYTGQITYTYINTSVADFWQFKLNGLELKVEHKSYTLYFIM